MHHIKDTINIILAGNPNVGKSTLFNMLTGQNQHTGNWTGKTVGTAEGVCSYQNIRYNIIDLPGTYSLNSFTPEEEITCNSIKSNDYDIIVIVVNSTTLESNLPLVLQILMNTSNAVLCLNMIDEANSKHIIIDTDELSLQLGIPVIPITAKKKKYKYVLLDKINLVLSKKIKTYKLRKLQELMQKDLSYIETQTSLSEISKSIVKYSVKTPQKGYTKKDLLLDKIFTSPKTGIPIMFLVFSLIFWLTAYGSNYPGEILTYIFNNVILFSENLLYHLYIPDSVISFITDGVLTTTSWVVSVMLPPALIFFPLFAILEECGYLPRVAFNLDRLFSKAGINGKVAITMLMGFGCNTCGVMGCRIIKNKRERFIAIVTNSFIPCNGRFPTLISLCGIFFSASYRGIYKSLITTLVLIFLILLAVLVSLVVSVITTKIYPQNNTTEFILELPPYRKPQFIKLILDSIRNKVIFTLSRAVMVALPAGAVIWLLVNIDVNNMPIINYITDFMDPIGSILGLDGVILTAFFLGFPANEIVIPTTLMIYLNNNVLTDIGSAYQISEILKANNWTTITAICTCVFCLFHFPCSTTCLSIKRETKNLKWTALSIVIPLITGTTLCFLISLTATLF